MGVSDSPRWAATLWELGALYDSDSDGIAGGS